MGSQASPTPSPSRSDWAGRPSAADITVRRSVTTAPDASYSGGVVFANGFVLGASAPGALPLQLWFRAYAGASQDYLTVASPAGVAWAQAHGYTLIDAGGASGGGWVLPAA